MSLYEILGVPIKAKHNEITASYKRLVLVHHPNLHAGDDRKFLEITRAFRVLGNPKFRYHYDVFGERALEYLNDSHAGEFIVNLYDRTNLLFLVAALGALVLFLVASPYLCILRERLYYSAILVPFYASGLLLLVPFFRTWRFLRPREQYRNEKRAFLRNAAKALLFGLQVVSFGLYCDSLSRSVVLALTPTAFFEGFLFYEACSPEKARARHSFADIALSALHLVARVFLVYGLFAEIPVYFKCPVPFVYTAYLLLLKDLPLLGALVVSLPVLLLSISVTCFVSGKLYWLGIATAVLFDIFLAITLVAVLRVYKNTSRYVTSETRNPSLIIIN